MPLEYFNYSLIVFQALNPQIILFILQIGCIVHVSN